MGDYAIWLDDNGLPTDKHEQVNKINIKLVTNFMKQQKMALALPLVGPNQPPSKGAQGELEQKILDKEDVSRESFKIPLMPEATAEGKVRAVLNPVWNLVQEELTEDEYNEGKQMLKLAFNLNRGSSCNCSFARIHETPRRHISRILITSAYGVRRFWSSWE